MTYNQRCATARFAKRKIRCVLAAFGPRRGRKRNGRQSALREGGIAIARSVATKQEAVGRRMIPGLLRRSPVGGTSAFRRSLKVFEPKKVARKSI